jgi:hypothetical protein
MRPRLSGLSGKSIWHIWQVGSAGSPRAAGTPDTPVIGPSLLPRIIGLVERRMTELRYRLRRLMLSPFCSIRTSSPPPRPGACHCSTVERRAGSKAPTLSSVALCPSVPRISPFEALGTARDVKSVTQLRSTNSSIAACVNAWSDMVQHRVPIERSAISLDIVGRRLGRIGSLIPLGIPRPPHAPCSCH